MRTAVLQVNALLFSNLTMESCGVNENGDWPLEEIAGFDWYNSHQQRSVKL